MLYKYIYEMSDEEIQWRLKLGWDPGHYSIKHINQDKALLQRWLALSKINKEKFRLLANIEAVFNA